MAADSRARCRCCQNRAYAGTIGLAFLTVLWPAPAIAQPAAEVAAGPTSADIEAELVLDVTQGALRIAAPGGGVVECPLTHTDVRAEISGFLARVRVTQTFKNPKDENIEAVYVFPLPHQSAIDEMTMVIGERRIEGKIKRRDEARRIYEQALYAGRTAALLEQERPNIFTQSVGNIPPGATIRVEISYVDVLKYDQGEYEFSFPMVVGPRFNPGTPSPPPGLNVELAGHAVPGGTATTRVPDGDRINPPILRPGHRTGHDISLTVHLDAGVPVQDMKVSSHESSIERPDVRRAVVKLNELDSIPNKDFVLRYDVTGEKPAMALLAHKRAAEDVAATARPDRDAGYFMLMVQPADDERLSKSPPREIVFLIDVSGSMSGEPTQKVIETMQHMLKLCREGVDTVQVVTFASQANRLFDAPVPVNGENIGKALQFTGGIRAGGGTQMLEGVKLAMDQPVDPERVRIVVMLTDGYIGNEAEIIEHVGRRGSDQVRFWCVGIGASPNMFLIDGVARQGGGMGKQLNLNDDAQTLATEIITRIQRAQLSNVEIDWGGLSAFDTFPARLPELWAGRPLILFGRYANAAGPFAINVKGRVEGEPATWPLTVELPESAPQNDVLAPTWARQKIEDLMQSAYYADSPAVAETVTAIALDYRLMSQYTSFVAVDDSVPTADSSIAPPHRMLVPVPLPAGTRWEGFFGPEGRDDDRLDLAEGRELLRRGLAASVNEAVGGRQMQQFNRPALALDSAQQPLGVPASSRSTRFRGEALGGAIAPASGGMRGSRGGGGGFGGGGFGGGGFSNGRFGDSNSGGRVAGQAGGRGGRAGRGGSAPAQVAPSAARRPMSTDGVARFFSYDITVTDELGRLTGTRFAIADKIAGDQELAWFNPPAQNADPAAYVFAWEQSDAGPTHLNALAQAALAAAKTAIEAKDVDTARRALQRAIFFAEAQANRHVLQDSVSAEASAELQRLRTEQVETWKKAAPWLNARLDFVLRDVPVADAVAQVFAAAKQVSGADAAAINIVSGSLDDVAALGGETRIHYLDVRGATLADALEWMLLPARLTWQLDGQQVTVASARRLPGASCWVYDVADLALPRQSELGDPANQAEFLAKAQQECDAVLNAVRAQLGGAKDDVHWFAPGQVLIVGDAASHRRAAAFFAELADVDAAAATDLHRLAHERIAARKQASDAAKAAQSQWEAIVALETFGWPLLRNAAEGRLDVEALTELQIAWKSLDRAKLSAGAEGLLLRTAWIVSESARALPAESELAGFAATIVTDTQEVAQRSVAAVAATGEHTIAEYLAATYAGLARRDDAEFSRRAFAAISAASAEPSAWLTRSVVPVLSGRRNAAATGGLAELVRSGQIAGEDAVVLSALACRVTGDEAWAAFRMESGSLLGRQPLAGDVVVLVNGLSISRLPLVASARR